MAENVVLTWIKDAKRNAGWLIALGTVSIVVGFMAIGSPLVAGMSVAAVVGFFMIIAGLSQLISSLKAGSFGSGGMSFLGGFLTSLAGLLLFLRPLFGLGVLAVLLGIYFFADGVSGIALAFKIKPEKGWGWMLFSGVVALILCILIIRQWPLSGAWAIGTLVGIHLIFRGFSLVAIGTATRGGLSQAQESLKEGETVS